MPGDLLAGRRKSRSEYELVKKHDFLTKFSRPDITLSPNVCAIQFLQIRQGIANTEPRIR
jgi:hypothetical protein